MDTHALAKDYAIAALKKRIEGDANPSQVDFSLSDSYLLLDKTLKNHDYKQVESDIKVQLKKKNNMQKINQQVLTVGMGKAVNGMQIHLLML